MIYEVHEIKQQHKFIHITENKNTQSSGWKYFNNGTIYVSKKLYKFIYNLDIDIFYYPETWDNKHYSDEYYNPVFYDFIISENPPEQTFLLCSDNKHLYSKLKLLF